LTQTYPEATVGALVVNEKGEVLIVRSHKWGSKYTVPVGHI
jgi:nucleoside triphosphatase